MSSAFADGSNPRVIRGIGDDTSVTLFKTLRPISLSPPIHLFRIFIFRSIILSRQTWRRKALQVSLSDIAAMGGVPRFFLVSLTLPPDLPTSFIDELYDGFKSSSQEYSVELVGGNTTSSKGQVVITVTVLGEAPKDEVVFRDGAKAGEKIYVTGTLGDSALGLRFLKDGLGGGGADGAASAAVLEAVKSHLNPVPRLKAGRLLAKEKIASSMMDISDGLVIDLTRLMHASGTGARIEFDKVPLSEELLRSSKEFKTLALYGGRTTNCSLLLAPIRKLNFKI